MLRAVAEEDDDRATRIVALTALPIRMESDIPLLLAALGSPDPVKLVTAVKGLLTLASRLGPDVVAHALRQQQALDSAESLPEDGAAIKTIIAANATDMSTASIEYFFHCPPTIARPD